jgi:hypothetical protein
MYVYISYGRCTNTSRGVEMEFWWGSREFEMNFGGAGKAGSCELGVRPEIFK